MEKIIDGVDVYKCSHFKRQIFDKDVECKLGKDCSEKPNCYFKQLKRLEKENEELKEKLEKIKEIVELQLRNCSCNLTDYKSGCKSCESKYAREISLEVNKIIEEKQQCKNT